MNLFFVRCASEKEKASVIPKDIFTDCRSVKSVYAAKEKELNAEAFIVSDSQTACNRSGRGPAALTETIISDCKAGDKRKIFEKAV